MFAVMHPGRPSTFQTLGNPAPVESYETNLRLAGSSCTTA